VPTNVCSWWKSGHAADITARTDFESTPQSETLWSVHETPGDLIRLALGLAVALWIVIHLFTIPKTVEAYKRWVYLGLVVAPVSLAAAVVIWR
jgi:hypothetical protein